MLKFILNKPIISAIFFIALFEIIFQHYMLFSLYILLIYGILKLLNLTGYIKKYSKIAFKKLLNYYTSKNNSSEHVFVKNEDGSIEIMYFLHRKGIKYWVMANKNNNDVTIRLFEALNPTKKPLVFKTSSFFITPDTLTHHLDEVHFNS